MESKVRERAGWHVLVLSLIVLGLVIMPYVSGTAQEQSAYERALARRIAELEYKLQHVTGGVNEVVITGANLRIVNGLGATETINGLGNLIVGYNEPPIVPPENRDGSHNIVMGTKNNFASFGGLVGGTNNEISGSYASIIGGTKNTASGDRSTVSGGGGNSAIGDISSVSGGANNTASGGFASVSGGQANRASGGASSVSGGNDNTASGFHASVSGGFKNSASGSRVSSVSGGDGNTASGEASSVSGGAGNTASGFRASVSGGFQRTAPGENNWAAGPLFAVE
jgi:hypothetical protein